MIVSVMSHISWVTKALNINIAKIIGYSNLQDGWNHGEGEPISREVISTALQFERFATSKFLLIDSIPGLGGEIQLAIFTSKKKSQQYLEVTISSINDINITKYVQDKDGWNLEYDIDFDSIEKSFQQIICFKNEINICRPILEYYQKNNFSHISGGLEVVPLKTIKAEYQFFKGNALTSYPTLYASI